MSNLAGKTEKSTVTSDTTALVPRCVLPEHGAPATISLPTTLGFAVPSPLKLATMRAARSDPKARDRATSHQIRAFDSDYKARVGISGAGYSPSLRCQYDQDRGSMMPGGASRNASRNSSSVT